MYIVMYSFKVKPEQEGTFLESWRALTKLIYKYEGSLGSRLHKKESLHYIAYAQWPDKLSFDNSGSELPLEANKYRDLMRSSCEDTKVIHKFEVVEDLLMQKQHDL
ncbi:antibiotic biosynthesis monooxygenase [Seonamhaeicola sp.]|uniref:antibiotic biosynthesis monooxygenase family protein n=1 Tax=Seonamhaeicola sp. TaxID=1912245 RepID=UPI002602AD94|nr:antibiotic biosynthesis monooxygenase [Seonamhaeicola sp.]